jgi:hypothetical protein
MRITLHHLWEKLRATTEGTIDARIPAIFRIGFGTVLLLNALLFWNKLGEYFSEAGVLTSTEARALAGPHAVSLFYWFSSDRAIQIGYAVLLIVLAGYIAGYRTRVMQILALLLVVSFHNRNIALFHNGDLIARVALVLTLPLVLDGVWSLRAKSHGKILRVSAWPLQLLFLQLCFVYLSAGLSKLGSPQWMDGSFVLRMLTLPGRSYFDWTWLAAQPIITTLMTYWVVLAEFQFIFFFWNKRTRLYAVLSVMMLHLGIWATVNVVYFSETMLVLLLAAIPEETYHAVFQAIASRVKSREGRPGLRREDRGITSSRRDT